jgi:DNA-binding Lrp family transcriptional regulator
MPQAYVLLNVDTGAENDVLKQLKSVVAVEEAYVSYGVYDLIVRVKAETTEELQGAVTRKIRSLKQVRSTLTLTTIEE